MLLKCLRFANICFPSLCRILLVGVAILSLYSVHLLLMTAKEGGGYIKSASDCSPNAAAQNHVYSSMFNAFTSLGPLKVIKMKRCL